jgi:hypothetical protein
VQQIVNAAATPALVTDVRGAPNKLLNTRFVQ